MTDPAAIYREPEDKRTLRLLGHFHLAGAPMSALGSAGKRLTALLAVHAGAIARWRAAQLLYPLGDDVHAATNLRAALWRAQPCVPGILSLSRPGLPRAAE